MSGYLTERAKKMRKAMDGAITAISNSPSAINESMDMLRVWQSGVYAAGDVRVHEGIPYKCVQTHDATDNPTWTPDAAPALWMQYHGTTPETARAWIAPTGAHDVYRAGEYMIFTDGKTYKCLSDTAYSPADYAQAWGESGK